MTLLDVRVLGPVEVHRAGRVVALAPKQRQLLALLAVSWPELVSTERLVDDLWEGRPPATARKILQKYVFELRTALGAQHIVSRPDGYVLCNVAIDSVAFTRDVETALPDDAATRSGTLSAAVDRWRGEPFVGLELAALEAERTRLIELRLHAIDVQVDAELALGHHAATVGVLEQLVAEHPLREGRWAQLMRALYGAGRPTEALRAYRRLRTLLADELGVEPSPELQDLERRVLTHDASLRAPLLVPGPTTGSSPAQRRLMTIVALELDPHDEDAEDAARSIARSIEAVSRLADDLGGRVESVIGRRIVVSFGAPAHDDDLQRAEQLAHQAAELLTGARAGVATGWALVQRDQLPPIVGTVIEEAGAQLERAAAGEVVVDGSAGRATRPEPPFVGRRDELGRLQELVTTALCRARPVHIALVGDAGVGKSRLVDELRSRTECPARWLVARCGASGGADNPLAAVVDDRLLEGLDMDPSDRQWLRQCLGVATTAAIVSEHGERVAGCSTLLSALSRQQPTVLVIEDVHVSASDIERCLAEAIATVGDEPLVVVTTSRPSGRLPPRSAASIGVGGLGDRETDELLEDLLPGGVISEAQRRALRRRSGGNPLYAIHFAQLVREGGWDGSVPPTVWSVLAARLDRLDPTQAEVVVAVEVLGQQIDPGQLAEVASLDVSDVASALTALMAGGLVERSAAGQPRFTHALIGEVAYAQLSRSTRARLHQVAADSIERRAGERLDLHAMAAARHLDEVAKALEADGLDSYPVRRKAFDLMVLAGDRLADVPEEGIDAPVTARHAEVLGRQGRLVEAEAAAGDALEAAQLAGDRSAEARCLAVIGNIKWLRGDTAACLEALHEGRNRIASTPSDRASLDVLAELAFVSALLGETDEAIALAEEGLLLAGELGAVGREVRCLSARGAARLLRGDLGGYDDFTTALDRALAGGLSFESAMAYHNLAELHWQGDGPAPSLTLNGRGLDLAVRRGLGMSADWLRANRAAVCFDAGRWDETLDLSMIVLGHEALTADGQAGTACEVCATRVRLWRGDVEEAHRGMDRFLPRARRHAVTQQLGSALIVAGLVETASGNPTRGADLAAEFCVLTETTHAYRHMELADTVRLLLADGRLEEARAAAAETTAIPTVRNLAQSATATALVVEASGDPGAAEAWVEAAERWRAFGHPLEEHLATTRVDPARAEELAKQLRLRSPATLLRHDG